MKIVSMRFTTYILTLFFLLLLSACKSDEPEALKPVEERTVLVLSSNGDIYNQVGVTITYKN